MVASVAVLVLAAIGLGVWWSATTETRIVSYRVTGSLSRVEIDAHSGGVEITDAGGSAVEVTRTDRYGFGRPAHEQRSLRGGILRIASSCPRLVVGSCSSGYRIGVPQNVPVVVQTGAGSVRITSFRGSADVQSRSGDVIVDGFCGFALSIKTTSGDARATATCSPQSLSLRSSSGNVQATVPAGGYRLDAESNHGRTDVSGIQRSADAPYEVQALSDSGNVTVRGGG